MLRDIKERGRDVNEVLGRYNKFVREDFNNFVKPYMKYADLIIPGGADNNIGFQFIIENLKNHQKKIQGQQPQAIDDKNVINEIFVSQEELKGLFTTGVFYEYDSSNSHATLMIEGLILKFTKTFFEYPIPNLELPSATGRAK